MIFFTRYILLWLNTISLYTSLQKCKPGLTNIPSCLLTLGSCNTISYCNILYLSYLTLYVGLGGAVRFIVVGTIGQEERPPQGQLWMEQCLTSLKYWPIWYTIWADPNYTWGLAILADSLLFSVNSILAGLWVNCISSVEITLFLLADILLQHRALFQCKGLLMSF